MATPLIPQEIYLLERFCSPEWYGQMRDAWEAMLRHAENMLERFMYQLPPRYRARHLSEQPDIVWGERVLPNFRSTMQLLNEGYIKLVRRDLEALGRAYGVTGGIRGQTMDFPATWMNEVETGAEATYYDLLYKADHYASPICSTSSGIWASGDLTTDYDEVINEPLNPPSTWPTYRLNKHVTVKSGDRVPQTGIYLPDVDHAFPTLLIKSDTSVGEANEAMIRFHDDSSGCASTLWTLIERVSDTSDLSTTPSLVENIRLRIEGGQPCPQAGYWFTLAKSDSRRHFKEGDLMPKFDSDYGCTIWQRDSNQF